MAASLPSVFFSTCHRSTCATPPDLAHLLPLPVGTCCSCWSPSGVFPRRLAWFLISRTCNSPASLGGYLNPGLFLGSCQTVLCDLQAEHFSVLFLVCLILTLSVLDLLLSFACWLICVLSWPWDCRRPLFNLRVNFWLFCLLPCGMWALPVNSAALLHLLFPEVTICQSVIVSA